MVFGGGGGSDGQLGEQLRVLAGITRSTGNLDIVVGMGTPARQGDNVINRNLRWCQGSMAEIARAFVAFNDDSTTYALTSRRSLKARPSYLRVCPILLRVITSIFPPPFKVGCSPFSCTFSHNLSMRYSVGFCYSICSCAIFRVIGAHIGGCTRSASWGVATALFVKFRHGLRNSAIHALFHAHAKSLVKVWEVFTGNAQAIASLVLYFPVADFTVGAYAPTTSSAFGKLIKRLRNAARSAGLHNRHYSIRCVWGQA